MDTNIIIQELRSRLNIIESKIEDIEKHIYPTQKKKNKNDEYQNINFIQYDKNKNIYNIKTSQGSSLNISISITEIKNMIDFLKYNDSYILNNYTIISTDNK